MATMMPMMTMMLMTVAKVLIQSPSNLSNIKQELKDGVFKGSGAELDPKRIKQKWVKAVMHFKALGTPEELDGWELAPCVKGVVDTLELKDVDVTLQAIAAGNDQLFEKFKQFLWDFFSGRAKEDPSMPVRERLSVNRLIVRRRQNEVNYDKEIVTDEQRLKKARHFKPEIADELAAKLKKDMEDRMRARKEAQEATNLHLIAAAEAKRRSAEAKEALSALRARQREERQAVVDAEKKSKEAQALEPRPAKKARGSR